MPPKKKKSTKTYKHSYKTVGQRVTSDGSTVIMPNGHQYKRTVLPSVHKPAKPEDEAVDLLDEVMGETDGDQEQS